MVSVDLNRRGEVISVTGPRINVIAIALLLGAVAIGLIASLAVRNPIPLGLMLIVGAVLMQSPRIAQQWERAIVLRLGRFIGLRGPGLFWVLPFVDRVSSWIDQRTITTSFAAEQTLTSDTVPVNVDAVLFWMVHDAQKAALEVQDYTQAVSWAAQTALRDIIGRTTLTELLRGRERIESELQALIDQRSNPVGRHRVVGRDARCRDPRRPAGRDVTRGAGGPRKAGAHHSRAGGDGDRALVRGSREVLPVEPDGAPSARDEHALRGAQGERRADGHPEQRRRLDGARRDAGSGGAETGEAHRERG